MNRKHKFRGKAAKDWRWVYGWYAEEPGGEPIIYPFDTPWMPVIVIPYTVGEFTGLHDKKRTAEYPEGQEIWEGDEVEFWISAPWDEQIPVKVKGEVCWESDGFWVRSDDGLSRLSDWDELEVIGTIHDKEAHNG